MRGIFGAMAGSVGRKSSRGTVTGSIEDLWLGMFGRPSKSGVSVNWKTALNVSTVLAVTRRIAESITVPCKVYQRDEKGNRQELRDHPLYRLLEDEPNQWQSGLEYRETIGFHLALEWNHYSYIGRVAGRIDELIPLEPSRVKVKQSEADGSLRYHYSNLNGTVDVFDPSEIWHLRGPSWTGAVGLEALTLAKESIGLAIATEQTHAMLHSNGANPSGIFTSDNKLGDPARKRLKEQWGQTQVGLANKFKTAVLDNGIKWQQISMTGVDSQHIQTRQFQVEEICRAAGVMPIMVGYSGDKAPTFASAEQMFLQHLVHTVRPWQDRVASSAKRWLLTRQERRRGIYIAFTEEAFLSPAMKDKAEYFKIALGGGGNPGWLTPNQVRAFQELAPEPGGDRLYVPMNTIPIGPDGWPRPNAVPAPSAPEPENDNA